MESLEKNVGLNVGTNVGLNKTEKLIISNLLERFDYTAEELAEKTGLTKRTIERALSGLQKKGKIKRIGAKKAGHWLVV